MEESGAEPADESDALPDEPRRLGRFELVLRLDADDALEPTYLATQPGADGEEPPYVTARIFPAADRSLVRDARRILGVCHTNAIQLIDADESNRGVFVIEDYVPGLTLEALAALDLPRAMALRILTDALFGLHVLHERKETSPPPSGKALFPAPPPSSPERRYVHRALSPRSIVVGTDGIARIEPIAIAGPPRLRAPEDAGDRGALDRRADVWVAGAIAWEIVTGTPLPERPAEGAVEPPPRVRSIAKAASAAIDDVLERALRVDPESRTADAQKLAIELSAAAREDGLLADLDTIAAHVKRQMQTELERRRARLAEVRKARERRRPSAPDVRTMIGMPAPSLLKRGPLPALPEMPIVHDDGASELRIEVALPRARPAERAADDVLGEATAAPPPEPEDVVASPLGLPLGVPLDRPATSARSPLGEHARAIATRIRPWFGPPWTTTKISVLAGVGAGLLGFFVVLLVTSGSKPASPTALVPPPATNGLLPSPPPAGSTGPAGATSAPASAEAEDATAILHLKANSPIAQVRVGGRDVDAVVPAPTVSVDLTDDEKDSPLHLVVTGVDGRVATVNTMAGELDVDVIFAERPPAPRGGPARPAGTGTVKHPWSKRPR